jgi:hypothetical protein
MGSYQEVMDALFWLPAKWLQFAKFILSLLLFALLAVGYLISWAIFADDWHEEEYADLLPEARIFTVDYRASYITKDGWVSPVSFIQKMEFQEPPQLCGAKANLVMSKTDFWLDSWAERKMALFYREYVKSGMYTAALQDYIVATKNKKNWYPTLVCSGPSNFLVLLPDAPLLLVHFRYGGISNAPYSMFGFCLEGLTCLNEDFFPKANKWKDLKLSTSAFTDNQKRTMEQLDQLGSDQFWLLEAHKNKIFDDRRTISAAEEERQFLSYSFASSE